MLCDLNPAGSVQCSAWYGGCLGGAYNACYPYHIWSGTKEADFEYHTPYLAGVIYYSAVTYARAHSVRTEAHTR